MSTKNSKDLYNADGRTNLFSFDPEKLIIVEDRNHPLYDERIHLPLDEALVANIQHHGVIEPVILRKNPESGLLEVVDGRQRVRCSREANKRNKKQGFEPILVPAIVQRGEDSKMAGIMVSANELRTEDTPMNRARKMSKLKDLGNDDDRLALLFGVSKQTVKNYLALLEVSSAVRNAVDSGKIPVSEAYKLAKLDAPQQKETIEKMLAAAATATGGKRRRRRAMSEASGTGPKLRGKREVDTFLEKIEEKCSDPAYKAAAVSVLKWVLGGAEPRFPRASKTADQPSQPTAAVA